MNHTKECQERSNRMTADRRTWEQSHPKFCRGCNGFAAFSSPGSSVPCGSTFVHLPDDINPCSECSEQGLCPWCRETLDDPEADISECTKCEWNSNAYPPPTESECLCYFDEAAWVEGSHGL